MAKGPKYLNPADKARKEARKKELKKNKKQREQVRSAVIKGQDPEQILEELRSLDKQEYNPKNCEQQTAPAVANIELVCRDKRKRLKELLQRILSHYQKEEPEKYEELKKLETEYEAAHKKLESEFIAIRAAKEVKIDEVFLPPEATVSLASFDEDIPDDDPLMSESIYITPLTEGVEPPGCPQGPPPDLKSLVDSLKDNMSVATTIASMGIPPSNLPPTENKNFERFQRRNAHSNKRPPMPNQTNNRRTPGGGGSGGGGATTDRSNLEVGRAAEQSSGDQRSVQADRSRAPKSEVKKAAVIESKPIMFLAKATKFVPASVRSKLPVKVKTSDGKPK